MARGKIRMGVCSYTEAGACFSSRRYYPQKQEAGDSRRTGMAAREWKGASRSFLGLLGASGSF